MGRPSKAAQALEQTTPKKARLTIAQLAAYDDVLTDVLVDHVSPLCFDSRSWLTLMIRSSPGITSARTLNNIKFATTNTRGESMGRILHGSCLKMSC